MNDSFTSLRRAGIYALLVAACCSAHAQPKGTRSELLRSQDSLKNDPPKGNVFPVSDAEPRAQKATFSVFARSACQQTPSLDKPLRLLLQDVVSSGGLESKGKPLSDRQIIGFAISWNYLRHSNRFQKVSKDFALRLPARYVTSCCLFFFGRVPRHQNAEDWKYRDGFYSGYGDVFEQLGPLELEKVRLKQRDKILEATVTHPDDIGESSSTTRIFLRLVREKGHQRYLVIGTKNIP